MQQRHVKILEINIAKGSAAGLTHKQQRQCTHRSPLVFKINRRWMQRRAGPEPISIQVRGRDRCAPQTHRKNALPLSLPWDLHLSHLCYGDEHGLCACALETAAVVVIQYMILSGIQLLCVYSVYASSAV